MSEPAAAAEASMEQMTRGERKMKLAHLLLKVLWAASFGLTGTARTGKLLDLCNHDMAQINFCNTVLWTAGNLSIAMVSPLIGALSDGTHGTNAVPPTFPHT